MKVSKIVAINDISIHDLSMVNTRILAYRKNNLLNHFSDLGRLRDEKIKKIGSVRAGL